MSDDLRNVTIVGGGYAGTILAAELVRRGVSAWLVERRERVARGAAYSTEEPVHLLNVPAHNMSAFAGEPGNFERRFIAAGGDRSGFAERRFYGDYLVAIFDEACSSGLVAPIVGEAIAAEQSPIGWSVALADGRRLSSTALVLAIGNEAPAGLAALRGLGVRYLANPWGSEASAAIRRAASDGGDILIVGTGLTMVDTVLSLDEAGFSGHITALSRRGLAPRGHAPSEPAPVALDELPRGSVRSLVRWLRRRSAKHGWRTAIDSLRPHSHALWQALPLTEQRRFIRHVRPLWDVHRHRIAPEVAARIARLVSEGRLTIAAGRVLAARDAPDALLATVQRRGGHDAREHRFALIVNCTGPLQSISDSPNPLLRSLLDHGLARPDQLDIGLEVADGARVAGAPGLWALGSLTKGRYWEITAVPDIRVQAATTAEQISKELQR